MEKHDTSTQATMSGTGNVKVKNLILEELELLTNQGKFEELVNLYITTFLHIQPDAERLRKIKKKLVKKLASRKEAFELANIEKVKMKVLDDELEMQINMLHNQLTRTIILLVSYMVKHGNDETTKEVFRWIKEHRHNSKVSLYKTMDDGVKSLKA